MLGNSKTLLLPVFKGELFTTTHKEKRKKREKNYRVIDSGIKILDRKANLPPWM
jgi:hypothetical protein